MKEPFVIAFNPKSEYIGCNIINMLNSNVDLLSKMMLKYSTLKVYVMPLGQYIAGKRSDFYLYGYIN